MKNGPVAYILRRFAASPQISASSFFFRISISLSRSLSLWAFELISDGSIHCLIGHKAVCEEKDQTFFLSVLCAPPSNPFLSLFPSLIP